jgi:hypothetical protein
LQEWDRHYDYVCVKFRIAEWDYFVDYFLGIICAVDIAGQVVNAGIPGLVVAAGLAIAMVF